MEKSITLSEMRLFNSRQWYSIPELATRWQTNPNKVCNILEEYNIKPERFECGGWVYWKINGLAVLNI